MNIPQHTDSFFCYWAFLPNAFVSLKKGFSECSYTCLLRYVRVSLGTLLQGGTSGCRKCSSSSLSDVATLLSKMVVPFAIASVTSHSPWALDCQTEIYFYHFHRCITVSIYNFHFFEYVLWYTYFLCQKHSDFLLYE